MKLKKTYALILAAAALVLAGCGDGDVTSAASSSKDEASSSISEGTSSSDKGSESHSESQSSSSSSSLSSSSSSSASEPSSTTSSSEPVVTYPITVDAPDGVTVTVDEKAEEGALVKVVVDAGDLILDSVTANGHACGLLEEGTYYFQMPAEAVTIVVTAHEADVPGTLYDLTVSGSIALQGAKGSYEEGEEVSFSVLVDPGMVLNGDVKITSDSFFSPTPVEHETSVGEDGNTVYSFQMPAFDVLVTGETTYGLYELVCEDPNVSGIYAKAPGEEYASSVNGGVVAYKSEVEVRLKDTDTHLAKGIRIVETGEEIRAAEGEMSITFSMPHRNITVESLVDPYYRTIVGEASAHLTPDTYRLLEDGTYVLDDEFLAGETAYVKVEGVTADYQVLSLVAGYEGAYGEETEDLLAAGANEDGYYSYEITGDSDLFFVRVEEKDMTAYADAPFLGSYLGVEIYDAYNPDYDAWDWDGVDGDYAMTIDGSGIFSHRSYDARILSYDETSGNIALEVDGESGAALYGENIFFSSYRLTSIVSTDNLFAVRIQDGDDPSIYTVEWNHFGTTQVIQVKRSGEVYATAYADLAAHTVHFGVDFVLNEGATSILDTSETGGYKIEKDGDTLLEVGTKDGEFVLLDGYQGTYVLEGGTDILILDGTGKATYLGEEGLTYQIVDETHVTLKKGGETWDIELREGTYTVLAHHEAANELVGYTYVGELDDNEGSVYSIKVEFVGESKCYFTLGYGSYLTYIGGDAARENLENQTYVIDEEAGTVTVTTWGYGTEYDLVLTIGEGTLTFQEDISNIYPTADVVLTRQ